MTASELALLPITARKDLQHWQGLLGPLVEKQPGVTKALQALARRTGTPYSTLRAKLDKVRKSGWRSIVDRRLLGPDAWETREDFGLSEQDQQLVKTYAERSQRDSSDDAALDALLRDWRKGLVASTAKIDPRTGYPRGWSKRNLRRYLPTEFELKNARIGRSAAFGERRLVYTTRANLWVGSHYLFDDMWHDHFVNNLDQRKTGRPLEFHALDLYSANKFAYGTRVRTEEEGKMRGLKQADFRFLLAMVFGGTGYSPRGTAILAEHGTAKVEDEIARLLYDETGGLVTLCESGMEGAAAAAHQYAGRSKGNFRLKAALETLGNLIHNELAMLPGQTGKDRDHRPEQLHGLLKANDALLEAIAFLAPERIEMLRWPLLTIQQFRAILEEVYARINARIKHDLEGWDALYVPDRTFGGMRRMSPAEVHRMGAGQLVRLTPAATSMILARDFGKELTVRGMRIEIVDGEVSGDVLRFDARALRDREKYLCVLNPYRAAHLTVFDARGRFVAELPRIYSVDRSDTEALHREMGAARAAEAEALQPFRSRHAAQARKMAADARHNAAVLSGHASLEDQRAAERQQSRAVRFGAAAGEALPTSTPEQPVSATEEWLEPETFTPETPTTPETW